MGNTASSANSLIQGPVQGPLEAPGKTSKVITPTILSEKALQTFEKLPGILRDFSENDPDFIKKFLDDYNANVQDPNLKINLDPKVVSQLDRMHKTIVEQVGYQENPDGSILIQPKTPVSPAEFQQGKVLNPTSKDTFINKMRTPTNIINQVLPAAVYESLDQQRKELYGYVDNLKPFLSPNTTIGKNVQTIVGTIVSLKAKYAFFEYKYIQLNIFLLAMIRNMYSILQDVMTNIVQVVIEREKKRSIEMEKIFELMKQMMMNADMQITPNDFDIISGMIGKLKEEAQAGFDQTNKTAAETYKKLNDTISVLGTAAVPGASSTIPAGGSSKKTKQKGGFVRGSSSFPQSFFDLPNL